jgi:hypothetical protein
MQLDNDAFSSSQILSKLWLAETLEKVVEHNNFSEELKILNLGGWYGIMHFILKARNNLKIKTYRNVDLNKEACDTADLINKAWVWQNWKFKSINKDANLFKYNREDFNVIINTSVEHIESKQWFDNIPEKSLVILQSNNMPHDDHVSNHNTLQEFVDSYLLTELFYHGQKMFQYDDENFFKRFMIIGIK